MFKKLIFIGFVLGLLAAGVGYYFYNKPLDSVQSMRTDISIDASGLLIEFENNEAEANGKYLDKVVEVKGTILELKQQESKSTLYLDTNNPMSSIICELEKQIDVSEMKVGDQVTVKGICTGYLMDVVLVRCIIE